MILLHVTEDELTALCGAEDGELMPIYNVQDPEHPNFFTCGACWKILAGGLEPMGGSLHRSEAHEEQP